MSTKYKRMGTQLKSTLAALAVTGQIYGQKNGQVYVIRGHN